MNGNNNNTTTVNGTCNQNQIPKNLPLKKRRAYMIDSSTTEVQSNNHIQDENYPHHRSSTNKQTCPQEDPLRIHVPPVIIPTPPSSPHMELLRQQYAYLLANSATNPNLFLPPNYDCLMAQKVLAQQFLDNYRTFLEQQYPNSSCGYTLIEDQSKGSSDGTIDEHFRKSLGEKYEKSAGGFLTPEDSSSNSSPTEKSPVDSIEEHFARSLGKLWPLTTSKSSQEPSTSSTTESVVDDHFAKALGAKTWEILKEKS